MARLSLTRWWWWRRRRRQGPWRVTTIVAEADQIPDVIPTYGAALVRSDGTAKWLVFDCPCGTGHRIILNLDCRRWPKWSVASESPLTLRPSVDVDLDERRCHYVIRHGHVTWIPRVEYARVRPIGSGVDREG